MLSNHLIGNYKFVLFVDNIGLERNSKIIIEKLLQEQNQSYEIFDEKRELSERKCLVIDSLSKLELNHNEKEIFTLLHKLKLNENVIQLFGWISTKNVSSKILVPFLEHMSSLIVTIHDDKHLTIISKSKTGVVKFKEFNHELGLGKTYVKEYKKDSKQNAVTVENTEDIENIGTFKIGQKADELEAKRNLKLPFEKM